MKAYRYNALYRDILYLLITLLNLTIMEDFAKNTRLVAVARLCRNAVMLVAIALPIVTWLV